MMLRKNSILKPYLTFAHKGSQFAFAAEQFVQHKMKYRDHLCTVHTDEKWFYVKRINQRYYMFPEEDVPARFVSNKHKMTKVMFFIAVAQPRYDAEGNCTLMAKLECGHF